ncbi:hypothetical protein TTRE_0000953301, partial [Trichuris trichiura]
KGPYRITAQLSPVTYRIQHAKRRRDVHVVHADRLKTCPPDIRLPEKSAREHAGMRRQTSPRPPSGQPDLKTWSGRRQAGGYLPARMVIGEDVCTENAGAQLFEHPSGSRPVLSKERPRRATRPPCRFADYIIETQRHRRHEDMTFPRKG